MDEYSKNIDRAKRHWQLMMELHPFFFVAEPLVSDDEEKYCFSYEYIIKEKYLYGGVIYSKGTKVVEEIFGPEGYDIRPMTREEFESKYLIDRITTVKFPTEIEMVEYCNKMRNIFNNQEK